MKKQISIFTILCIIHIVPLIFKPALIVSFQNLFLAWIGLLLLQTQPAFSIREMITNKKTDKFSILIILFSGIFTSMMSLAEWAYQQKPQNDFMLYTGLCMMAGGLLLRVWSIYTLGRFFTATVSSTNQPQLIKTGPYAFLRHPSYSGAYLILSGVPVFLNTSFSIPVTFVLLFIAYYYRIVFEEKMLAAVFNSEYADYARRVKRLIPFIW